MDDADARRDDGECVEGLLGPLEKFVALAVADKLDFHVAVQGRLRAGEIDLHGVVDDEVDRNEWLDLIGGGATSNGSVARPGSAAITVRGRARSSG